MEAEDAFANLPPVIADALLRAETRYRDAVHAENPFQHLPVLASGRVCGAAFAIHENNDPALPEDLAQSPIILHCENARFRGMTRFVSCHWLSDFAAFTTRLIHVEAKRRTKVPLTQDDEWGLLEYGLQVADDAYVVGFTGPDTATITNKDLVLGLLRLASDAFVALRERGRALAFDPGAIRDALGKISEPLPPA